MKATQYIVIIAVSGLALTSCRESDPLISPGVNTRVEVSSDPAGASIILDDVNTGKVTTDVLRDLKLGSHSVLVRMTGSNNVVYGYRANVDVKSDSLHRVTGPLIALCVTQGCVQETRRYHTLNNIRASTTPNGALFYFDASEKGLIWPASSFNGYAAVGTPMIAAVAGTRDTLSLGIYDVNYMAGRPTPQVSSTAERFSLRQSFWIVPIPEIAFTPGAPSIRGIEVDEELIGTSANGDVAYLKLTFRNITNRPSYQAVDPFLPSGGITYTWVYIGFGMDGEVGLADDDGVTYDSNLDMVYMYDFDFRDFGFQTSTVDRPGLIGLRLLEAPAGATVKALTAWPRGFDWVAGDATERGGWYQFSGIRTRNELSLSDVPGQHIGYAPNTPGDYRMSVSAGPLTLTPGQSASMTVAIILASPVEGTFTSGQPVPPENPLLGGRQIERIAKDLLDKARSLVVPD